MNPSKSKANIHSTSLAKKNYLPINIKRKKTKHHNSNTQKKSTKKNTVKKMSF